MRTPVEVQHEVLRQIDDPQSKLYQGSITKDINRTRSTTQNTASLSTASASLSTHRDAKGSTRKFDVGSTIELWKHGDDAISCTVESTLGEGAHGLVLKVKYADRTCALKVKKFDKESSHRFLQLCDEASLTVDLNFPQSHPHVVGMDFVRSMDKTHELLFLMEFVSGKNLKDQLKSGSLHKGTREQVTRRLLRIVHQLALSLEYLHSKGVLHHVSCMRVETLLTV